MPAILFLLGDVSKARNDNHERLPRAFGEHGWRVVRADHDRVAISANELRIDGVAPDEFDLIWPLGFGREASFFDRMQLLRALPERRMVTSADALTFLHGKHRWLAHMPETHTSSNLADLRKIVDDGGRWVLKPTAGSYGRDVILIRNPREGQAALTRLSAEYPDAYLMLQRYAPEVEAGEKRTLVAGGQIVGAYLRWGAGLLSNVSAGADVSPTTLTPAERGLVMPIVQELVKLGARFAAVDTVYPYLMEVNVANPGGLGTLETLGDAAATRRTVEAVESWWRFSAGLCPDVLPG